MCEFIPFELFGKKFRYYNVERIESEFRNVEGNWKPMTISNEGNYKRICFNIEKKKYRMKLHRVIYFVHNPDWDIYDSSPDNFIDHIEHQDGVPLDNSIGNLRVVSKQQNQWNTNAKGYTWHIQRQKWQAQIAINGYRKYLGCFDNECDAHDVYLAAKALYHIIPEN